jgi:MFS family permease
LCIFAGIGGPEHGYFEILQGNTRPDGIMIASMGLPCQPEEVWHACEPTMTILPNFLATGILATILGIITIIWAAAFVHRRRGGLVLIVLSIALLLFGGGIFPPIIGIVAGVLGTRIHAPVTKEPTALSALLAKLWPWPLVAFLVWLPAQFVVGHFFNEFMLKSGSFFPLLIVALMVLAVMSAFAYDRERAQMT